MEVDTIIKACNMHRNIMLVTCGISVAFTGYSTNKSDSHHIAELLLNVELNTITHNLNPNLLQN
jgi:hypothetical protein